MSELNKYQRLCNKITELQNALKNRDFTFCFHKTAYDRAKVTLEHGIQQDFFGAVITIYSSEKNYFFRHDLFVHEAQNVPQTVDDIVTLYYKNRTLNQTEDNWWE